MKPGDNTHWRTSEIVKLLESPDWDVEVLSQGGDVDSENLILTAKGAAKDNALHICGFVTEGWVTIPDDCIIEMIEVTDGQNSSGGLNTNDRPTGLMYLEVKKRLEDAGYSVVRSLKGYW